MDIRDVLCGVYDGSVMLPAAVACPQCRGTAVLYPSSCRYPWLYCGNCETSGQLRRASVIARPRVDCRPATHDDIPRVVLFIKRLCGVTCNAIEARRLLPFFVTVAYARCRRAALVLEDAPGRHTSTLSVIRHCGLSLVLRAANKDTRIAHDPGIMFAARILRQQTVRSDPLFIFPIDDAMRLHAEHVRTCDCVLPVVSAVMPAYFNDIKRWCASICSVLNVIAARRRVVCIKARSLQDVPPNLLRWAARLHAGVFIYESLPPVPDVHALLRGVARAALWRHSQRYVQFAGPESRKVRALPLFGDCGVLQITSSNRPLLRHGDMWYRAGALEPILDCDVRLQEIVLPAGIYRYVVSFGDQQVSVEVRPGEPIVPAIMRAFAGQPVSPIIEAEDHVVKRLALAVGTPRVVWRR